jgi:hypothetical protein
MHTSNKQGDKEEQQLIKVFKIIPQKYKKVIIELLSVTIREKLHNLNRLNRKNKS